MNNRILAMLLAIIMIVSIVPVNADATTNGHTSACTSWDNCSCADGIHTTDSDCEHVCPQDTTNPNPSPVTPPAHTDHVDVTGPNGVPNGVCDIDGCTEHVHKENAAWSNNDNGHFHRCVYDSCNKEIMTEIFPHVFEYTYVDENGHKAVCKDCKKEITSSHVDANNDFNCDDCKTLLPHTHVDNNGSSNGAQNGKCDIPNCQEHVHKKVEVAANDPGCETQGNLAYIQCEFCEAILDENGNVKDSVKSDYILNAKHDMTAKEAVEAKCGKDGQIAYFFCEVCDQPFADAEGKTALTWKDVVIPGLKHDNVYTAREYGVNKHGVKCNLCTLDAEDDCKDENGDHKCDKCGGVLVHGIGHLDAVAETAPTCTVPGLSAHFKCKNEACGLLFVQDGNGYKPVTIEEISEIPAKGHAPTSEYFRDKTHHWQRCDHGCGSILNKTEHTGGEWSVYPSNTDQHRQICTVCSESFNISDHTYEHEAKEYGSDYHASTCTVCENYRTPGCVDKNGDHKCDDCKAVIAKIHETGLTYVAEVPAKCGVEGVKAHYKCNVCGVKFSGSAGARIVTDEELKIDALEHDLSFGCAKANDNQTHTKTCKREDCNYQVTENHNDGTNSDHKCGACRAEMVHDWAWEYGDLYHNQKCKVCDKKTNSVLHVDEEAPFCKCDDCGKELAHNGVYVEWLAETCTTDGHTDYYQCTKCGVKYLSNGQETDPLIPAPGHDWGEARVIPGSVYHSWHCQRPGCTGARIEMHDDENDDCVCDTCGAFAHGAIKYMPEKEATCTEEGHQAYYYYDGCSKKFADEAGTTVLTEFIIYGATGHNENGEWEPCEDGEHHEKYCVTCGEFLESAEHVFNGENPYCEACGAPDGLEFQPEVPATCTTNGTLAHYKSSITGRRYWDLAGTRYINDVTKLIIPAAHKLTDWTPGATGKHVRGCQNCRYMEEGTCSSNDTNCACDVCGGLLPGHSMTYVEPVAATCTKNGILASWYCAKCDKYYDAETVVYLPTVVQPALGHRVTGNWRNDVTENAHSKYCVRCQEKITEAHELEAYDLYSGNLHEWRCSVCTYKKSEQHNYNGDSICDDCEHDTAKTVDVGAMDNDRVTVKVETDDDDDTVQEKKASFWKGFVEKIKPSYVGESQSPSAPSASVQNPLPNGSGVSSGSTGAGQTSTTTNSSGFDAVIDVLWGLLNALGSMLGL